MKHLKKIKQVLKKYNFQGSPNEVAFCANELKLNLTSIEIVNLSNKI